jgi:FtsP/CotA-like multicopper oxidase with cupredoxin domain
LHLALSNGQNFCQIGTDQGLLPAPVPLERLLVAPGERSDLIVDFADHTGEQIILNNDSFQAISSASARRNFPTPVPSDQRYVPCRRHRSRPPSKRVPWLSSRR